MVEIQDFCRELDGICNFFTGVPDSLLKDFCAYLSDTKKPEEHIIAANEGNSVALAAGHFMATGSPACVYMQNSGLGNTVNPLLSLMDEDVYKIPMLMIIGWRGEPGKKDEPQHVKQGKLTLPLLDCMGVPYAVLDQDSDLASVMKEARDGLDKGLPFAIVVKKGSFSSYKLNNKPQDISSFPRESAISLVLESLPESSRIVSTTGKISRELFELREQRKEAHQKDFLVVGSMGHTSQIALGAALSSPETPFCCLDGDGSVLMHMGSMAVNGSFQDLPFVHIMLNNAAHDTVGGQPTVSPNVDFPALAKTVGYRRSFSCSTGDELESILKDVYPRPEGMTFIEVKVAKGSRDDLGRPTVSALDCRLAFQKSINK